MLSYNGLAWANAQTGLTPSELACLRTIAQWVDGAGVAIGLSKHAIAASNSISTSTVKRALRRLHQRDLLTTTRITHTGLHGSISRHTIPLHTGGHEQRIAAAQTRLHLQKDTNYTRTCRKRIHSVVTNHHITPNTAILASLETNQGLIDTLTAYTQATPGSREADTLAATLIAAIPAHLAGVIRRAGTDIAQLVPDITKADDDIISRTWEIMTTHTHDILNAASPWGYVVNTVRGGLSQETRRHTNTTVIDMSSHAFERPRNITPLHQATTRPTPDYDDLFACDSLIRLINELTRKGMSPHTAFAGTLRILQLAVTAHKGHKHTRATQDATLWALGVSPEAARAWMTALIGTRSSTGEITTPGLLTNPDRLPHIDTDTIVTGTATPAWAKPA